MASISSIEELAQKVATRAIEILKEENIEFTTSDEAYLAGYEQGRADERVKAIDEFVKALEEHQQKNWIDNLEYGITFADIEEVAKRLKTDK